jgi:hypothetical protein
MGARRKVREGGDGRGSGLLIKRKNVCCIV